MCWKLAFEHEERLRAQANWKKVATVLGAAVALQVRTQADEEGDAEDQNDEDKRVKITESSDDSSEKNSLAAPGYKCPTSKTPAQIEEEKVQGFLKQMIGKLDCKRKAHLACNMKRKLTISSACTGNGMAEVVHILSSTRST